MQMRGHTLGDVARAIGATLNGLAERAVGGMATLAEAGPNDLCFVESTDLVDEVRASRAAGVIVGEDFPALPEQNLLRVTEPRDGFVRALELFVPDRRQSGVHPSAVVADDAKLGEDVGIGPLVVVDSGAVIGDGCQLRAGAYIGCDVAMGPECDIGPNTSIMDGTHLGARCILHAGVVLGSDGYGYTWRGDHHHKIPQLGCVMLGDDVEIGGNTCIDRATLAATRVGSGCKFDNLVHVAHNNEFGEHVLLTGQVGIAGSSRIGNGVVMGGQAGVTDHVTVGDGAQIGGQSGVLSDVPAGAKIFGTPGRDMGRSMRAFVLLDKLPEMRKRLRSQDKELDALRERIAALEATLAQ